MTPCPRCQATLPAGAQFCRDCGPIALTAAGVPPGFEPGRVLNNRYRIVRRIGRGGMSIVYQAEHLLIPGRMVALKVPPVAFSEDRDAKARFAREADVCLELIHPNVVRLYNIEEVDGEGGLFLVMEYIGGPAAHQVLAQRRAEGRPACLSPAEAVPHVVALGHALDAAHAKGIIHRDIKPSNLLFTGPIEDPATSVKLADFGIAAHVEESIAALTGQGNPGTPPYMSPEQVRGKALRATSDVFSLGSTLYQLLSGTPPFRGEASALTWQVVHEDPPPPPAVAPEVAAVIARAMRKEPAERFQTAGEFTSALAGRLGTVGGAPTMELSSRSSGSEPADDAPPTVPEPPPLTDAAPFQRGTLDESCPPTVAQGALPVACPPVAVPAIQERESRPSPIDGSRGAPPPPPSRTPRGPWLALAVVLAAMLAMAAGTGIFDDSPNLAIAPSPADSRVTLDGKVMSVTMPVTLTVSTGKHQVRVEKPGYKPYETSVEIEEGHVRTVSPTLVLDRGSVFVISEPPGAAIQLDGAGTGEVAPTNLELAVGKHELHLMLAGHEDWSQSIEIRTDETIEVEAKLVALDGAAATTPAATPEPLATATPAASPAPAGTPGPTSSQSLAGPTVIRLEGAVESERTLHLRSPDGRSCSPFDPSPGWGPVFRATSSNRPLQEITLESFSTSGSHPVFVRDERFEGSPSTVRLQILHGGRALFDESRDLGPGDGWNPLTLDVEAAGNAPAVVRTPR